jgi:glycosyltransferase involved in cell wall biosynthesis
MPAYMAERTLQKTLDHLPLDAIDEIILVDDASTDGTADLARRLGLYVVVHPENRGYGGNQKTCYKVALERGADVVVLLHPDFQYDPTIIRTLIQPIVDGEADFVFGSRYAEGGNPRAGGMPLYRHLGNRALTAIENLFMATSFTELHSGYKAYSRLFLEAIGCEDFSDHFVFDSQLIITAVFSRRFRIKEVPIPTRYEEASSSVNIRNSLRYVGETLIYLVRSLARQQMICRTIDERLSRLHVPQAASSS